MGKKVKPHHGRITNWAMVPDPGGMKYFIIGKFLDHPMFAGKTGHTSYVVKHDLASGEIETRNSRYTLKEQAKFEAAS